MSRWTSILLLFVITSFGSGALEYVHNLEHAREDAIEEAQAKLAGHSDHHVPVHDENNCFVHSKLHMACLACGWASFLAFLGIFIALVIERAAAVIWLQNVLRLDCRGPPVWG